MAGGRPPLDLDEGQIEKLASIMCSMAEIGAVMGCSPDTLQRRYAAVIEKGREKGKMSLKRKQYEVAMTGNCTMLIWLGKQHLEQRDKTDIKTIVLENKDKILEEQARQIIELVKMP